IWGDGVTLYATDGWTSRILKLNPSTGETSSFSDSYHMTHPAGVWGDGRYLWGMDGYDQNIVRRIDIATQQTVSMAGSGALHDSVDGTGPGVVFTSPGTIWGDGTRLYIVDTRLRVATANTIAPLITSMTPTSAPRASVTNVTITGVNV